MSSPGLTVRPMELEDFDIRIAYFNEATDEHLDRLGVDRSRLPTPHAWRASFAENLARPLDERSEYGVVWELDAHSRASARLTRSASETRRICTFTSSTQSNADWV